MEYQARWLFSIGPVKISETVAASWLIIAVLAIASFLLTRNLKKVPETKRQVFLEFAYIKFRGLVVQTMGENFVKRVPNIVPYLGSVFLFFLLSNWGPLFGLRSPTTDLNTTLAWALMTVFLIYFMGIKFNGLGYFSDLIEPTPLMLPLNIIGEFARPISLSFRPFGNILGGSIIMALVYSLLGYISGFLPGPNLKIGEFLIPVPLHMYFDIFAGTLQAFIFLVLTMVFVGSVADGLEDAKESK